MKWKKWWWVGVISMGVGLIYLPAMREKRLMLKELEFRLEEMEKEKIIAALEREDLMLRIQSQNDPAWIEMVLMRDLGVVPEGWLKVHFKK